MRLRDDESWPVGRPVRAAGSDVVIGHVTAMGTDDAGVWAEIELTPAALGVGYERPVEGEEEDPFG